MKSPLFLIRLAFGVALLFVFAVILPGSADTITVDDDIGADYSKIQDAVNASLDGDTVRVFQGTYNESIHVNKEIQLMGNGSKVTTILGWEEMDGIDHRLPHINRFYVEIGGISRGCVYIKGLHGKAEGRIVYH